MTDIAEATATPEEVSETIKFTGSTRNLVPGMAMLLAGILAFFMDMTDVFFAEAMAWTFIIWGVLLVYAGMIDIYETFELTDESLIIRNAVRPWSSYKEWDWDHISRLEVQVRKKHSRLSNARMQIYYTQEGELALEREDRGYDPEMAELVIERAGLKPASKDNPSRMDAIPMQQDAMYTWQ